MAKGPTITTISTGYYSTTALNDNFTNIDTAFDNTLSLDGSTPNAMQADFDLNGNNIINAGNIFIDGGTTMVTSPNITISTDAPSGGVDGDLWVKIT